VALTLEAGNGNAFFFGDVCPLLPVPLCVESVLFTLTIAVAVAVFRFSLTASTGSGEGVGKGKAVFLLPRGTRLLLTVRVEFGVTLRTGVRPVTTFFPQLAELGKPVAEDFQ
jgi:hypothetical protein